MFPAMERGPRRVTTQKSLVGVEVVQGSALGPGADDSIVFEGVVKVAGVGGEGCFLVARADCERGEAARVVLALGGDHVVGGFGQCCGGGWSGCAGGE